MDVFVDYRNGSYLFFSSFSTYTLLCTALSYQLFILDITYVTRKVRFLENSQTAELLLKHDKYWRYAVISSIIGLSLIFTI